MSKRTATTELNHENWDKQDDDEEEPPRVFQQASEDILKQRVIKKAKRRVETDGKKEGSTFIGFTGFGKTSSSGSASSVSFGFLNNVKTESSFTPLTNTITNTSTTKSNGLERPATAEQGSNENSEFLSRLKTLNEGFLNWIQQHIDKNPYCILTPVLKDYDNHLTELEKKHGNAPSEHQPNGQDKKSEPTPSLFGQASFSSSSANLFRFGKEASTSVTVATTPTITSTPSVFGGGGGPVKVSSMFTIGASSNPSSIFGAGPMTSLFGTKGTSDISIGDNKPKSEEGVTDVSEYAPPKNEFTAIVEEDAFYSIKCKLFYKLDKTYVEKGTGMLHLKTLGDETQLLVRGDSTLGHILLNIRLSENIPIQRVGKNNVMVACVPFPKIESLPEDSPTPLLIRVRTAEEADELFGKLKK